MKTGIIYHKDFKKYDFGPGHPLRGHYVDGDIAFRLVKSSKAIQEKTEIMFIEPASAKEADMLAVHTDEYLGFLESLNKNGGFITLDTPVKKGMYDIARLVAGADILAGKMAVDKIYDKVFVLGMMGHHAGADFGGGFCLTNDIAVMVKRMQEDYGLKRIAVFDYAVNAGHGTTSIFYDTSRVLCIDIHQDPLTIYPGTGFQEQVGRGDGKGYTVNIPLPPFTDDNNLIMAVNEIVVPILIEYRPELLIVAGLNGGHYTVQINQFMLTLSGLYEILHICSKVSDEVCEGKFVHIGGFSLDTAMLPLGFLATIAGALDVQVDLVEPYEMPENISDVSENITSIIENIKKIHRNYWDNL